ncbi:hypothetical protein KUM39_03985 [Streptomyces sp. J2-1]|uniref:DUF6308 family protein n=1 Tax=Streptomyces corallincola TaxID=2851888 RepID=UPI001C38C51A|nr:DUF6308 family protein [Streptomyces corallincola]MBV2353524.1 hypothetical protein [Streptomyces corallincola]
MPFDDAPAESLAARLHRLIGAEEAEKSLRSYFGIGGEAYTGSWFESLAGGGDRADTANVVTAEDLIAVQTLSVTVPVRVAVDLLEGDLGRLMSEQLARIPVGVDMADAAAAELAEGSAAHTAWTLLRSRPEVGWVIAGKLMARKRPRLLPVYDNVVKCALGRPRDFWLGLHAALRAEDGALHRELTALGRRAGVPGDVSALRVCDVVVWTGHHERHRAKNCAGG